MKRDFSEDAKQRLLNLVDQVGGDAQQGVLDEIGDLVLGFAKWTGLLHLKSDLSNVSTYHKLMIDMRDTSRQGIEEIFRQVHGVDSTYGIAFNGYNEQLARLKGLIHSMTEIVSGGKGNFTSDIIINKLENPLKDYQEEKILLNLLDKDQDSETTDFSNLDPEKLRKKLSKYISKIVSNLPDVEGEVELEIPIGIGTVFYYKTKVDLNDEALYSIDVTSILNEQKLQLSDVAINAKEGDETFSIGGEVGSDGDVTISTGSKVSESKVNTKGEVEYSVIQNNANGQKVHYTIKISQFGSFSIEETVENPAGNGTISTTAGIRQTTYLPPSDSIPAPVPVIADVPLNEKIKNKLESIDWNQVKTTIWNTIKTTVYAILGIVIIAGVVFLVVSALISTGGTAAVLIPAFV